MLTGPIMPPGATGNVSGTCLAGSRGPIVAVPGAISSARFVGVATGTGLPVRTGPIVILPPRTATAGGVVSFGGRISPRTIRPYRSGARIGSGARSLGSFGGKYGGFQGSGSRTLSGGGAGGLSSPFGGGGADPGTALVFCVTAPPEPEYGTEMELDVLPETGASSSSKIPGAKLRSASPGRNPPGARRRVPAPAPDPAPPPPPPAAPPSSPFRLSEMSQRRIPTPVADPVAIKAQPHGGMDSVFFRPLLAPTFAVTHLPSMNFFRSFNSSVMSSSARTTKTSISLRTAL